MATNRKLAISAVSLSLGELLPEESKVHRSTAAKVLLAHAKAAIQSEIPDDLGWMCRTEMRITSERFAALLDGTATDVTGQERLIRQEAFSAERRGEDPMLAVESRLLGVSIVKEESYRSKAKSISAMPVTSAKDSGVLDNPKVTTAPLSAAMQPDRVIESQHSAITRSKSSRLARTDRTMVAFGIFFFCVAAFYWLVLGPAFVILTPIGVFFLSFLYRPFQNITFDLLGAMLEWGFQIALVLVVVAFVFRLLTAW